MNDRIYNFRRNGELEAAIMETRMDLDREALFTDTIEEHIRRITDTFEEEGDKKWPKIQE
jgi:hypothetical protein